MSELCISGKGVPLDLTEGARWLRMSADNGFAHAQYNLGVRLKHGEVGLEQDSAEAFTWFRRSARQGHMKAQTEVARACMTADYSGKDQVLVLG